VTDASLTAALAHALNKDPEQRSRDVRRSSASWRAGSSSMPGEEPAAPGPHSSSPPPLPASQRTLEGTFVVDAAVPQSPASSAAQAGMRRIIPLAVAGIVVGLLGG